MFWEEGKPEKARVAMYNPSKLSIEIGYQIHEKSPVGWSGQLRQGTGTIEKPFEVELLYTQRGLKESPWIVMQDDLDWFGSFCYPIRPGEGPAGFCINWPSTYQGVGRIGNLRYDYEQWDMYLRIRRAKIIFTFHPYRLWFKRAAEFKVSGFREGTLRELHGEGAWPGPPVYKK